MGLRLLQGHMTYAQALLNLRDEAAVSPIFFVSINHIELSRVGKIRKKV